MGKHQLGELSPNEFVVAILISNIATLPVENAEIPLIRGIVPVITLVCIDVIVSSLAYKSRKVRRLVSGSPKVIISDGKVLQSELKKIRYTTDDLMESMRKAVAIFTNVLRRFIRVSLTIRVCLIDMRNCFLRIQ
jgi:uncharacterized membrane protein YcaP (DUF421 family)